MKKQAFLVKRDGQWNIEVHSTLKYGRPQPGSIGNDWEEYKCLKYYSENLGRYGPTFQKFAESIESA